MLPLMIASIASPLVSHRQHRQSDGCKGGNNVNLGIVSKERKKRQPMNFLRVSSTVTFQKLLWVRNVTVDDRQSTR